MIEYYVQTKSKGRFKTLETCETSEHAWKQMQARQKVNPKGNYSVRFSPDALKAYVKRLNS